MQYKHLGRTGLQVSRLALGAMNFGELTDETAALPDRHGASGRCAAEGEKAAGPVRCCRCGSNNIAHSSSSTRRSASSSGRSPLRSR
jgi:hypothetical protein